MKHVILLIIGLGLLTLGLWPSIITAYFPANLIPTLAGGMLVGWNGAAVLDR